MTMDERDALRLAIESLGRSLWNEIRADRRFLIGLYIGTVAGALFMALVGR